MSKRLSFLLLDANVIIELFRVGLWDRVVEQCDLHLARAVMGEAHFYEDAKGDRQDFDLAVYEQSGAITVFDVPLADTEAFRETFDPSYFDRLDPGEAESLAFLVKASDEFRICSADSIVFRLLGNIDRGEQGVSLEEILKLLGLGRTLTWPFTKKFRKQWTGKGVEDSMYGTGSTKKGRR